jgi:hypothetical protein
MLEAGFKATAEKIKPNIGAIYAYLPLTDEDLPYLTHEIEHIIQYIAEEYKMDLTGEKENLAYLDQYITDRLINY